MFINEADRQDPAKSNNKRIEFNNTVKTSRMLRMSLQRISKCHPEISIRNKDAVICLGIASYKFSYKGDKVVAYTLTENIWIKEASIPYTKGGIVNSIIGHITQCIRRGDNDMTMMSRIIRNLTMTLPAMDPESMVKKLDSESVKVNFLGVEYTVCDEGDLGKVTIIEPSKKGKKIDEEAVRGFFAGKVNKVDSKKEEETTMVKQETAAPERDTKAVGNDILNAIGDELHSFKKASEKNVIIEVKVPGRGTGLTIHVDNVKPPYVVFSSVSKEKITVKFGKEVLYENTYENFEKHPDLVKDLRKAISKHADEYKPAPVEEKKVEKKELPQFQKKMNSVVVSKSLFKTFESKGIDGKLVSVNVDKGIFKIKNSELGKLEFSLGYLPEQDKLAIEFCGDVVKEFKYDTGVTNIVKSVVGAIVKKIKELEAVKNAEPDTSEEAAEEVLANSVEASEDMSGGHQAVFSMPEDHHDRKSVKEVVEQIVKQDGLDADKVEIEEETHKHHHHGIPEKETLFSIAQSTMRLLENMRSSAHYSSFRTLEMDTEFTYDSSPYITVLKTVSPKDDMRVRGHMAHASYGPIGSQGPKSPQYAVANIVFADGMINIVFPHAKEKLYRIRFANDMESSVMAFYAIKAIMLYGTESSIMDTYANKKYIKDDLDNYVVKIDIIAQDGKFIM